MYMRWIISWRFLESGVGFEQVSSEWDFSADNMDNINIKPGSLSTAPKFLA